MARKRETAGGGTTSASKRARIMTATPAIAAQATPQPPAYKTRSGRSSKRPVRLAEQGQTATVSLPLAQPDVGRSVATPGVGTIAAASAHPPMIARGPHFVRQGDDRIVAPPLMQSTNANSSQQQTLAGAGASNAPTLLGLPMELRNQIYRLVLQSDHPLVLKEPEEAVLIRNAPAELLPLNHPQTERSDLIALRDTRISEMNALQKHRMQEIEAMDLATGLDDAQDAVDNPSFFFDTSLIRVNSQIHSEAKVEFLRVNSFQFNEETIPEPELKDGNHHPRRYNELGEAMLAHSLTLEVCVPWHDLPLLSTHLRHRKNLKLLNVHLVGPLENRYELETFLRFLRVVHATEVRLTWVEPVDSDLTDRGSQVDDALVKDAFDSAIAEMQSGGVSAEVQGEQYPPRFRGLANESAQ